MIESGEGMFISDEIVPPNKIINGFAPIVLFTYNRLAHTKQTIEALKKNIYADQSELYIFSDGAKDSDGEQKVKKLRKYLYQITGFRAVHIIERNENWGLAKNIIDGVTRIVNQYGKIIVLEDDIVTSRYFLQYMNEALAFYQEEKKVMQISGTMFKSIDKSELPETFFLMIGECCGWATWSDRWHYFKRNPQEIVDTYDLPMIRKFIEAYTPGSWRQVEMNAEGTLCSWAVFFHHMLYKRKGLVLYPKFSLTTNIGFDGTGSNCGCLKSDHKYVTQIENNGNFTFEQNVCIKDEAEEAYKNFLYQDAKDLMDFVSRSETIFCYGAGEWGQYAFAYLQKRGIEISGFVVSDTEEIVGEYLGKPVYKFSELKTEKESAFILSLSTRFQAQIKQNLVAEKYEKIYAVSSDLINIIIDDVRFY